MAKFFVGQRVKKVRGKLTTNIGLTGTVVAFDPECPRGMNIQIKVDSAGIGVLFGYDTPFSAGKELWGNPSEWEPITPLHQPCESEFKESLDKLLEELPA